MTDYAQPAASLSDGASMPLLGFGTWQISDSDVEEPIAFALDAGYRHIDTATMYRNEAGIGRALAVSDVPRDDVFVTTKLPPDRAGRERQTLEESLSKLGLDRVDLWLIHWSPGRGQSVSVWEEFVRAQQDGLATSIGVSNFSLDQIDELTDATGVTPAVNQIRWAPVLFDESTVSGLDDRSVVLEGYSPFKVSDLNDATLTTVAEAHGISTTQVIVAWHAAHGFVVIPKSSKRERIVDNAAGIAIELTADEVASIDALAR